MVNDWTYAAEVYDDNRKLLSADDIEQCLGSVVHDATRRNLAGEKAIPVGILSADHRDRWCAPFTFSVHAAAHSI